MSHMYLLKTPGRGEIGEADGAFKLEREEGQLGRQTLAASSKGNMESQDARKEVR